jgi:hypothetical protein
MTRARPQKLQTATTGPTAWKVEKEQTVNNHEELELQLQDLNFAKLNQTRTKTMERKPNKDRTLEQRCQP